MAAPGRPSGEQKDVERKKEGEWREGKRKRIRKMERGREGAAGDELAPIRQTEKDEKSPVLQCKRRKRDSPSILGFGGIPGWQRRESLRRARVGLGENRECWCM